MADDLNKPHRKDNRAYQWVGGVVLILVGIVFLLQNFGLMALPDHWWAFFIFIPAVGLLTRAYQSNQSGESGAAISSAVGGLVVAAVAISFLLDLDIGRIWPVFLILAGVATLFGYQRKS